MNLIAYNSTYLFDNIKNRADVSLFSSLFRIFVTNMTVVDRTFSIKTPFNVSLLDSCRLPEYSLDMNIDYDTVCFERARKLMDHSLKTNRKIAVMWSGGVDSTLILVSFLISCNKEELKNISVLMDNSSISENRDFYYNYVLKNFHLIPSDHFSKIIGNDDYLLVSGEGNDQLWGNIFVCNEYEQTTKKSAQELFDQQFMADYVTKKINLPKQRSEKLIGILSKPLQKSPWKEPTVYQFLWWLNFTIKWQNTYIRSCLYATPRENFCLKPEENYTTFFHSDGFQLWAINKIVKDGKFVEDNSIASYKKQCKEFIFKFDKNYDYRMNKGKSGSLSKVILNKGTTNYITESNELINKIQFDQIYQPQNDFI